MVLISTGQLDQRHLDDSVYLFYDSSFILIYTGV